MDEQPLLGVGIYGIAEAARLSRVSAGRIRRWLGGYSYQYRGTMRQRPAVWSSEVPIVGGRRALGFLDLLEVRIVDAFIKRGVSLQMVRRVSEKAKREFSYSHPFLHLPFRNHGRLIFLELAGEQDEADSANQVYDFLQDQLYFQQVINPYLEDIDIERDQVRRWWPLRASHAVVLDPRRSFGKPILSEGGVPTLIIAAAVKAHNGDSAFVARWFEVPEASVRDAVRFEASLAA